MSYFATLKDYIIGMFVMTAVTLALSVFIIGSILALILNKAVLLTIIAISVVYMAFF